MFSKRLNYYLAAFFFNAFPLPQREAGARQTLRYIGEVTGDGFSMLIFPEGVRSQTGEMTAFRGGIGMIASRLDLPIVPVRSTASTASSTPEVEDGPPGPGAGRVRCADAAEGRRLCRARRSRSKMRCDAFETELHCRVRQVRQVRETWQALLGYVA